MAKTLSAYIQGLYNDNEVRPKFILEVEDVDLSSYLISFSRESNMEFGAASATFVLNNDDGRFGSGGANPIYVGDKVKFIEKVQGDPTEFKAFYGLVTQRAISKSLDNMTITLISLDYISILQNWDIDLEVEGTKLEVTDETLTPTYLEDPNENLAQIFDFANDSLADNPRPVIIIRNTGTEDEDPAYDGYEITYSTGQLKLGYPLNARYNYSLIASSYWFYTVGVYAEDVLEDILTQVDGYGKYLFDETTAQAVIDNHLTETFNNVEGTNTDTLTPNYSSSTITIKTTLTSAVTAGANSISVTSTSGFPASGEGSINGDVFTWSSKTATTLDGVPTTGSYALKSHANVSYVEYEKAYSVGQVWYLSYNNISTTLTSSDFIIPGGTFNYFDSRYGRIILSSAISTSANVICNTNYTFKTLQATGIELNKIAFRSRELENAFEAVKKLREYLAPNYIIRTLGDNKIWASYLSQKLTEDYEIELPTSINYTEDEDLYTRVIFYAKNKNPSRLTFNDSVTFVGSGETYKALTTQSELNLLREEDNYYVYGSSLSGVGKITANVVKPIVYVNNIPIDNVSHTIVAQSVTIETTTTTETSSGGK